MNHNDTTSEQNVDVDTAIRDAIKHYFDENMILDGLFWSTCIKLLQHKYNFKLESNKNEMP